MKRLLIGMLIVMGLFGCQRNSPPPKTVAPEPAPPPAEPVEPPPPDVVGNWTITAHHIPGVSAMSGSDAAAWHGRVLRLGKANLVVGEKHCPTPDYHSHRVDTETFLAKSYHLAPGALEPARGHATAIVTETFCGERPWTGLGAVMIGLDDNRALAPWDGVFFELEKSPPFRAVGQEPGWSLDFRDDGSMRFQYAYGESATTAGIPRPMVDPDTKARTWKTAGAAGDLVVVIEPKPCSDAMSGLPFETTVTVTYLGTTYRGCGWEMP
jgi:hypothetical protein